jgi:hypothetical protein
LTEISCEDEAALNVTVQLEAEKEASKNLQVFPAGLRKMYIASSED